MNFTLRMVLVVIGIIFCFITAASFEWPSVATVQRGFRGLGMVQVANKAALNKSVTANVAPQVSDKLDPSGQPASAVYQNVQVLKDVDSNELLRLMNDVTAWVSPDQGCAYCHAEGEDLSSDKLYTKVVARRMFEMVRHINADWKNHVADTGVTCFTCHRGLPIPANVWFQNPGAQPHGLLGDRAGQNAPAPSVGYAALPNDPYTPFLQYANEIRVISTDALPPGNRRSIKQAEWTYGLMMNISRALGVNCTFCHNSRSFFDWDQSTPQRDSAWFGIRMVRDLNLAFLEPLKALFPHERLGPLGDVPKINCTTCHQGAFKPLFGASVLKEYPELAGIAPIPAAATTPATAPAPTAPAAAPATPPAPSNATPIAPAPEPKQ